VLLDGVMAPVDVLMVNPVAGLVLYAPPAGPVRVTETEPEALLQ
jgi:hypothetical protein